MTTLAYTPQQFGAAADGRTLDTAALQAAIDAAADAGGTALVPPGTYLTGSLFLGSDMELHLEEGAVLLGSTRREDYATRRSRVAGVEMDWPAGVVNAFGQRNVRITGDGAIDGNGPVWWDRYWGPDRKGGMRADYERRGLRWAVDYDCERPRNVIVHECENVELAGFASRRSGFWNVHICYSTDVHVDGLTITDGQGPSTDGIDIDSSRNVVVERCVVDCNDDSVCLKAGRDADGLRVNRPCEHVEVRDCRFLRGAGVTLGSETSGGIRDVFLHDITFSGTACGFRIKSFTTRGGKLEGISASGLYMDGVRTPFEWDLAWHPAYSACTLPESWDGPIPERWKVLTAPVPADLALPSVRDISVSGIQATGCGQAFMIRGLKESPISDVRFDNVRVEAGAFGSIDGIDRFDVTNLNFTLNHDAFSAKEHVA